MTGIVMATRLEAEPFFKNLDLKKISDIPMPVYKNKNLVLIISGIGKANAAIATTYIINEYKLSKIVNIGAAGSTTSTFTVGQILHIDRVIEYDRPHLLNKKERIIEPDLYDGFPTASLATQDIPVTSSDDRKKISLLADLVDMEGAAVIQACRKFKKAVYLFKIVTDNPEQRSDTEIIRNVKETRTVLFDFFNNKISGML